MIGKKLFRFFIPAALLGGLLSGCNQNKQATQLDTPTSGEIRISVDETFAPIIDAQIKTFEGLYERASIKAAHLPEAAAIQALLNDSVRIAVISRDLTPEEKAYFEKLKLTPRVIKIAIDGIAFILNNSNPDTALTTAQLQDIFSGKTTAWQQISSNNTLGPISVVFDNNHSSTLRFVTDSVLRKQPLAPNAFAAKSNPNLVDYVAENKNAIGVIGVNWISDWDDSTAISFLNKVKVVGVMSDKNPAYGYVRPYQAYLSESKQVEKQYPFRRYLYIISREARAGLGTGFASFVAGDKGQRIILKSGLVPATMPVRIVGFQE